MSNSSSRQSAAASPWATYRPTALIARLKNLPEDQLPISLPGFIQVFATHPQVLPIKLLRCSFVSRRGLVLRLGALPLLVLCLPLYIAAVWGVSPLSTAVLAILAWALVSFTPALLSRVILAQRYGIRARDVLDYFTLTLQPQLLTYLASLRQEQDDVDLALKTAHHIARFQQWVDFCLPFAPAQESASRHHPSSAQRYPEPLGFDDPRNPYRNDFIDIVSTATGPVGPHLMFKRGVTHHIVSGVSKVPLPWRWILKDPTRLHGCDTRGTSFCLTLAAFSWAWRQELLPAVRAFQDGQASGADLETAYARFRARYPLTDPHGYQDHPHKH
ncbi:hypothetical protein [Rothia nasimurium]|uniref:hypothetical protein n=1 Tax=Rothia nasimurium TaxID=85336 RepID=UPI001F29E28A|nr:hypothetical protein [Rothia nasimurium]